jgi:hypothetical protein
MWGLKLDGWKSPKSFLQEEIRCAKNLGIKIRYFSPENYREGI